MRKRLLLLIAMLPLGALAACSAESSIQNGIDASTGLNADAAPEGAFPPNGESTAFVLIDGLVAGNALDVANKPIQLTDIRVCISGAKTTMYAVPDDVVIPLTNIPGIHLGGGLSLGSFGPGMVKLDIFSAQDLQEDSAWASSRLSCTQIACNNGGAQCKSHVELTAMLGDGVNVVALVDAPLGDGGIGAALITSTYADNGYAGIFNSLYGSVVNVSGWHAKDNVAAFYGTADGGGMTDQSLFNPLDANVASSPVLVAGQLTDYDSLGLRFDESSGGQGGADRFWQSLDSIAFVSDQTIDPMTFYAHRENFVFALVGDPTDVTSITVNGGRDPHFTGRGLHVTAIPYQ